MNAFLLIDGYIDTLILDFEIGKDLFLELHYLFFVIVLARLGNFAIHILFDLVMSYKARLILRRQKVNKSGKERKEKALMLNNGISFILLLLKHHENYPCRWSQEVQGQKRP